MKNIQKMHIHTLVLRGNFNPTIFQPVWFSNEGLLQKTEVEDVTIDVVHPDIVSFSLPWLNVKITRETFTVETYQVPYFEVIRDLVLGTFTLLRYTPIKLMGINFSKHIEVGSDEEWHSAGHKLAPKELWDDILVNPGMRTLSMEGARDDELKGLVLVQIEPSRQIRPGIFILVNEHYEATTEEVSNAEDCMNVLKARWPASYKKSETIISSLMEKL